MKLRGTQTGRVRRVKKKDGSGHTALAHSVLRQTVLPRTALLWTKLVRAMRTGIAMTCLLSACAAPSGGWHQPAKNEKLTQADYAACRQRAEESTLELSRSNRSGFGVLGSARTGTFNPRGDDTMAIAERSDTGTLFDALVANCMTQKGYEKPE